MTTPTIGTHRLLRATIHEPIDGNWHAEVESDSDDNAALSGQVTMTVDGSSWVGTVIDSSFDGGTVRSLIQGGNGWGAELGARNYTGPSLGSVLAEIMRAGGETLSSTVGADVTAVRVPFWSRTKGTVSEALRQVRDELGPTFRLRGLRDGTVWLGVPSWTAVEFDAIELDEDGAYRWRLYAPEALDLQPGVTLNGERVIGVCHEVTPEGVRTSVKTASDEDAAAGKGTLLDTLLSKFRLLVGRKLDYLASYPGQIVAVNGDGTVDVRPDDERIRGFGLARLPIRRGLPGWTTVTPAEGDRCRIRFDGGDPKRPYVADFEGTSGASLVFNEGTKAVARVDDEVRVGKILLVHTMGAVSAFQAFPASDAGDIAAEVARAAAVSGGATAILIQPEAIVLAGNESLKA